MNTSLFSYVYVLTLKLAEVWITVVTHKYVTYIV